MCPHFHPFFKDSIKQSNFAITKPFIRVSYSLLLVFTLLLLASCVCSNLSYCLHTNSPSVILLLHTGFIDLYAFPAVLRYSAYMARIYNERHSADLKNLHIYFPANVIFSRISSKPKKHPPTP